MGNAWRTRPYPLDRWVLAIVLLGFALRIAGLGAQGLFNEEGYVIVTSQQEVGHIISQLTRVDSNTPLAYLLMGVWTRLAGMSEFSARLLSVFAGVLTVALTYPLARAARMSATAGRWAAALVAVWPVCIMLAQEARMYALLMMLTTLSTLWLLRGLRYGRWVDWGLWSATHIAAFATHVLAAIIFAVQATLVVLIWLGQYWRITRGNAWTQRWRSTSAGLIAVVGTTGILAIWALVIVANSIPTSTTYDGGLSYVPILLQGLAAGLMPKLTAPADINIAAASVMVALIVITLISGNQSLRLVAFGALVGILAICAFSALNGKFGWRYTTAFAPLVAAGVGATAWHSLGAVRPPIRRVLSPAVLVAVCALCWVGFSSWRAAPANANEDFRGAATYLRQHANPGEPILIVPNFSQVFGYYFGPGDWHWLPEGELFNLNDTLDYDSAVPHLNRWLSGRNGVWLLLYDETLLDPSRLIQTLLRRQSVALMHDFETREFQGLHLLHYRFFQPYQPLPDHIPDMAANVEITEPQRGLAALGCHIMQPAHSSDNWMEVFCFWRLLPGMSVPSDTQVSLRLIDSTGRQIAQSDQPLTDFGVPYLRYEKPLTAVYRFPLPGKLRSGGYTLQVIPYTPSEQISPQVVMPVTILN
jgi:4-amino-4-deoxy-L-arabinose transferase-like glycosyltransferase